MSTDITLKKRKLETPPTPPTPPTPIDISLEYGLKPGFVAKQHQIDAFKYAEERFAEDERKGFLLADEMGLGKTITVLAILKHIYKTRKNILGKKNIQVQCSVSVSPLNIATRAYVASGSYQCYFTLEIRGKIVLERKRHLGISFYSKR